MIPNYTLYKYLESIAWPVVARFIASCYKSSSIWFIPQKSSHWNTLTVVCNLGVPQFSSWVASSFQAANVLQECCAQRVIGMAGMASGVCVPRLSLPMQPRSAHINCEQLLIIYQSTILHNSLNYYILLHDSR